MSRPDEHQGVTAYNGYQRQIGRKALVSKFRHVALNCTLEFGLTADDINEVACQIARKSEAYSDRGEAK